LEPFRELGFPKGWLVPFGFGGPYFPTFYSQNSGHFFIYSALKVLKEFLIKPFFFRFFWHYFRVGLEGLDFGAKFKPGIFSH